MNKLGDQLLGVLLGTVDIVTSGDNDGELERFLVTLDHKLSSSFTGAVGVGWVEGRVDSLTFFFFAHLRLSVYFIGTDVDESSNLGHEELGRLKEYMSSHNVGLGEAERVSKRVVDVSFSGKVHDGIYFVSSEDVVHQIGGANISLDKYKVLEAANFLKVLGGGAVGQLIQADNLNIWVCLDKMNQDIGPDKSSSTS